MKEIYSSNGVYVFFGIPIIDAVTIRSIHKASIERVAVCCLKYELHEQHISDRARGDRYERAF